MKSEPPSKLLRLPTEIWDHILSFLPNSQLHVTTLNLLSALANTSTNHPISILHLFKHLIISNDAQLKQLLLHSQSDSIQIHSIPRSFSLQSWKLLDNNILINLINAISTHITFIQLFIGPVFAPEQLEELFFKPKKFLVSLSLRFNQNVSRRSYEPFLKGSYFDNCCDLLAQWPPSTRFRSLSFVQDLPPPYQKSRLINQAIAQPIILFKFWCITNLATSPVSQNLFNLRFRIPHRNLTLALTNNTTKSESIQIGNRPHLQFKLPVNPFPNCKFLDLSTSFVPTIHNDLALILKRFPRLEYLILDRTQLIFPSRFQGDEERVNETLRLIGSTASSIGISRAAEISRVWRELKKVIETGLKEEKLRFDGTTNLTPNSLMNSSRSSTTREEASFKQRGRSSYASAPKWKSNANDLPAPSSSAAASHQTTEHTHINNTPVNQLPLSQQRIPSKLIILPSPSNLISICCGTDLPMKPVNGTSNENHDQIRNQWEHQFQLGWQVGLDKLEKSILEKLTELNLFIEVWKRSIVDFESSKKKTLRSNDKTNRSSAAGDNKSNNNRLLEAEYEAELDRLMKSKPILMIQETRSVEELKGHAEPNDSHDNQDSAATTTDVIEIFKKKMRLKEVEISEVEQEEEIMKLILDEKERRINFCSINDCESSGKVVWDAPRLSAKLTDELDVNETKNVDEEHAHEEEDPAEVISHRLHQLQIYSKQSVHSTDSSHHLCAHLVARNIWDLDSF